MTCKACASQAISTFPADVRVYLNGSRTMSAPPMNPGPMVHVCLSCGASEFVAPAGWLAGGWLRPKPMPETAVFAGSRLATQE
jgi:hypothetical protein